MTCKNLGGPPVCCSRNSGKVVGAVPQFVEEPCVLYCNDGLGREVLQ